MTQTSTQIIVRFQIEALHNWPDAEKFFPEMAFLAFPHRHLFYFEVRATVSHDDRDIEIIRFKRELIDYYNRNFHWDNGIINLGAMSCEMLGKDLMEAYSQIDQVQVLEDNENGAITTKI